MAGGPRGRPAGGRVAAAAEHHGAHRCGHVLRPAPCGFRRCSATAGTRGRNPTRRRSSRCRCARGSTTSATCTARASATRGCSTAWQRQSSCSCFPRPPITFSTPGPPWACSTHRPDATVRGTLPPPMPRSDHWPPCRIGPRSRSPCRSPVSASEARAPCGRCSTRPAGCSQRTVMTPPTSTRSSPKLVWRAIATTATSTTSWS